MCGFDKLEFSGHLGGHRKTRQYEGWCGQEHEVSQHGLVWTDEGLKVSAHSKLPALRHSSREKRGRETLSWLILCRFSSLGRMRRPKRNPGNENWDLYPLQTWGKGQLGGAEGSPVVWSMRNFYGLGEALQHRCFLAESLYYLRLSGK